MPDILVRNLDDAVVKALKERARRHHRSLQREAKAVLEYAASYSVSEAHAVAERWQTSFEGRAFDDSAESIRQDRNR